VRIILDDNGYLPPPTFPSYNPSLCSVAYLSDVPTYGNAILVWYDAEEGGNQVDPETTVLNDGDTYYAARSSGGSCESTRTEVTITISGEKPDAPTMESPQHFCQGALLSNIEVPNDKIVWYDAATAGNVLPISTMLEDGHNYYAAQKAGECFSEIRTPVTAILDGFPAPVAPSPQTICNGAITTLADIMVIGNGIRWYEVPNGGTELPETTPVVVGKTYYAAQSSVYCEGVRAAIEISGECYDPYGTVFPFVYTSDAGYNNQFITTAKLYAMPPATVVDKLGYIRKQMPIQTVRVEYYDCTAPNPIAEAPKHPGTMGYFNNAGYPIRWNLLGHSGTPNNETDPCPDAPVGKFKFDGLASGNYILEISRQGFLSCYEKIEVTGSTYLGHRELLGGDINGDFIIDGKDISAILLKESPFGHPLYNWKYDIIGNKEIGDNDKNIIRINMNAGHVIYQKTKDWINP